MKKYIYIITIGLLFFSCNKKNKIEKAVEEIPISIKTHRFEQAFFDAKPEDLAKVKLQYPDFFQLLGSRCKPRCCLQALCAALFPTKVQI